MVESLKFFCFWKRPDLVDEKIRYVLYLEDSLFVIKKILKCFVIDPIKIHIKSKQPFSNLKAPYKKSEFLYI